MKVGVTGATGYLGREVVARLLANGHVVRALVRRADAPLPPAVERRIVDLASANGDLGAELAGLDVVIHCAAHLGAGDREQYRRVNVDGTHALLRASERSNIRRVVHVSTIAVHGWKQPGSTIGPDDPYDLHPELRDDYAWSKIGADAWAQHYRDRGVLEITVIRPGIIYGPGREFVARIIRRLRGPLHLIGGEAGMLLPLVHVTDVADAVARAAAHARPARRPIHVVGPESPSQGEYLALRAAHGREPIRPLYVPFGPTRLGARWIAGRSRQRGVAGARSRLYSLAWTAQRVRYDLSTAARELGWRPRIDIAVGLQGTGC